MVAHVLRLRHGATNGALRLLQIGDAAAAYAPAALPAHAQHTQRPVTLGAADQADHLVGADIQHAKWPGA